MISVIVPVYNTEKYLKRCVDSLRAQTLSELEILLVDDGSTDGSAAMCDGFAAEDARVRVFHKANGGSSSARNLGIAKAEGEYLGFVDSDDYVDADMYEKLYGAIRQYHADIVQIGRDETDPDGGLLPDICIPPEQTECISVERFMEELLMHRGDCSFCTKLLRRELFFAGGVGNAREDNSFPTGVLNEDFHLLIQLLGKTDRVVSLPGHAYHVVYRLGSNSRKEHSESFSRVYGDSVVNADIAAEIVQEKYPRLEQTAFRFGIFQRLEYLLHIPISQMTPGNEMYRAIVRYLRRNWCESMRNPILTRKNKLYHTLFALAPCMVRKVHRRLKHSG